MSNNDAIIAMHVNKSNVTVDRVSDDSKHLAATYVFLSALTQLFRVFTSQRTARFTKTERKLTGHLVRP